MKIKTLLVAPYRGLMELASDMAQEQDVLELSMVHADLSEILPHLKQYEEDGYEIIISRGGTAKLISQYCSLPVIEIPVTGFDILRMLTWLKEYTVKLEMVGFPNIVEGVISISNVMDFHLPYTIIHNEREVESAIERAKERGVGIIVGDSIAVRIAEKSGLQGILITSGREAILEAFRQTKQVYTLLSRLRKKSTICEQLINQLDVGTARVTADGIIRYANTAFYDLLKISPLDEDASLFGRFPYFERILHHVESGWRYRDIVINDGARKFVFKSGTVEEEKLQSREYNVILSSTTDAEEDVTLHFKASKNVSLLPWVIGTMEYMRKLQAEVESIHFPLVIHGKKGTCKSVYAQALYSAKANDLADFFDIRIHKGTQKAVDCLKDVLCQWNTALYITGIEVLSADQQREILDHLQDCKGNLIFAFDDSLKQLHDAGKLDVKLFDWLRKRSAVGIPSLKEMNDFDAIVRGLIVKYNEKYGKQIVGIRPQVFELLHQHPWEGDLLELKNTIREFVKRTEGEFVDETVLSLFQEQSRQMDEEVSRNKSLNLKQPLKMIVRDIIQIVLEEENMNQSRVAERLGINRSTLWSKLKE